MSYICLIIPTTRHLFRPTGHSESYDASLETSIFVSVRRSDVIDSRLRRWDTHCCIFVVYEAYSIKTLRPSKRTLDFSGNLSLFCLIACGSAQGSKKPQTHHLFIGDDSQALHRTAADAVAAAAAFTKCIPRWTTELSGGLRFALTRKIFSVVATASRLVRWMIFGGPPLCN